MHHYKQNDNTDNIGFAISWILSLLDLAHENMHFNSKQVSDVTRAKAKHCDIIQRRDFLYTVIQDLIFFPASALFAVFPLLLVLAKTPTPPQEARPTVSGTTNTSLRRCKYMIILHDWKPNRCWHIADTVPIIPGWLCSHSLLAVWHKSSLLLKLWTHRWKSTPQ